MVYYIPGTRFSGMCLGEWRKNELKNVQHAILYHTHMTSYYDVMKYLCCSTCRALWQHSCITQQQRPAGLQIAGSDNKSN